MVKNYRGITLMDTGYKIYVEILRRRLEEQMEKWDIKRYADGIQEKERNSRRNSGS